MAKKKRASRRKPPPSAGQSRRERTAEAIARLEGLYTEAREAGDTRAALAAQRELNKLQALYAKPPETPDPDPEPGRSEADDRLEAIARHLIPVSLIGEEYPIEEHARVVAEAVRQLRAEAERAAGD